MNFIIKLIFIAIYHLIIIATLFARLMHLLILCSTKILQIHFRVFCFEKHIHNLTMFFVVNLSSFFSFNVFQLLHDSFFPLNHGKQILGLTQFLYLIFELIVLQFSAKTFQWGLSKTFWELVCQQVSQYTLFVFCLCHVTISTREFCISFWKKCIQFFFIFLGKRLEDTP